MNTAAETLAVLTRLRTEAETRLLRHPDYRVVQALDRVISELSALDRELAGNCSVPSAASVGLPRPPIITQADAAAAVLREHGKPMRTVDLVEPVRAKGARVSQNKPEASLSSSLSADSRFEVVTVDGRSAWQLRVERG